MSNRLFSLLCVTALLGTAVSCDRSEKTSPDVIGLTANVEDFETKGTVSGFWNGGEELAVSAVIDGAAEVRKYTASAGGDLSVSSGYEPFEAVDGPVAMSVWYPYSENAGQWEVLSNQSDQADFKASDFLYASEFQASAGSNDVVLYHQTAMISVNLKASDEVGADEIAGIRIGKANLALDGAFTAPAAGSAYGSWTPGQADGMLVPFETEVSGNAAKSYQAVVIPQDMDGKVFVTVVLGDGTELEYTPSDGAGVLSAGGNYEFNFTVLRDGLTASTWNDSEYAPEDLKPGDYFYSDGTWSDGGLRLVTSDGMVWEDEKPAPESGKKVIGIVFCTDQERIGQGEKDALAALGVTEPHGLVLSTISYNGNNYVKWYDNNGDYIRDETEIGIPEIGADAKGSEVYRLIDEDIEGYRSNMIMRAERADDIAAGYYPGFQAALDFASQAGGPDASAKTTGWFIPSNGQLVDVLRYLLGYDLNESNFMFDTDGIIFWQNLGNTPAKLNEIMSKIDNSQKIEYPDYNNALMSASQGNSETMRYIDFTESGYMDCLRDYKNRGTHVRCVLAF